MQPRTVTLHPTVQFISPLDSKLASIHPSSFCVPPKRKSHGEQGECFLSHRMRDLCRLASGHEVLGQGLLLSLQLRFCVNEHSLLVLGKGQWVLLSAREIWKRDCLLGSYYSTSQQESLETFEKLNIGRAEGEKGWMSLTVPAEPRKELELFIDLLCQNCHNSAWQWRILDWARPWTSKCDLKIGPVLSRRPWPDGHLPA